MWGVAAWGPATASAKPGLASPLHACRNSRVRAHMDARARQQEGTECQRRRPGARLLHAKPMVRAPSFSVPIPAQAGAFGHIQPRETTGGHWRTLGARFSRHKTNGSGAQSIGFAWLGSIRLGVACLGWTWIGLPCLGRFRFTQTPTQALSCKRSHLN